MTPHHHKSPRGKAATLIAPSFFLLLSICFNLSGAPHAPTNVPVSSLGNQVTEFHSERTYDLPSLVELALAKNPYTRASWFKAMAAAASASEAKSPYYPKIGLLATGGYDSGYNPIQTGPEAYSRVSINPGVQMEYLLLDFGRRAADVRRTMALLEAADLDYNRRIQTTLFALQQSYFSHTAALAQQEAATTNLEFARTTREMIAAQQKSGLATEPELLVATKNLSQAEFDLAAAKRNVEVTLGNLRITSGLPANAPLKVAQPGGTTPLQSLSLHVDQLMERALANRPDLAARTADIQASHAATDRAKADFLPKLSLQGSYSSQSYGYNANLAGVSGTFNGNYNAVGGFAVLSWDLFDGYERLSKVKKRQAEESEARANAETAKLETTRDVWVAYNDFLKTRKAVEYTDSQATSAKENFEAAQSAFQNGLATITDLISAQNNLANAHSEQAGANADYLTSLASLSLAIGQSSHSIGINH